MGQQQSSNKTAFEVCGLVKKFEGLVAVSDFNIRIKESELIGLIGPNGAGKTTLFNVVSGMSKPDGGVVVFSGEDITGKPAHTISSRGLIRTFQQVRLMPGMSVMENLRPAFHDHISYSLFGVIIHNRNFLKQEFEMNEKIEQVLQMLNIDEFKDTVVDDLPYGIQRKVGIARSLCRRPKMLLLDEPTAGLNPKETNDIMDIIKRVWEELGLTIIIVEHNMRVIMNISQRIVVMHKGRVLAEGAPQHIQNNGNVVRIYLGEKHH